MNDGAFPVQGAKRKAPINRTHSKGFARSHALQPARQRLECAGLSGAFGQRKLTSLLAILSAGLMFQPNSLWACAACYGQSDSPLARGMNWGIFSLLAVVVVVLGSVASFFVYLGRRAATTSARATPPPASEPNQKA